MRYRLAQHFQWVVLLAIASCSFANGDGGNTSNYCDTDEDCPGSACDLQDHVCFKADELNFQIALEVVSKTDSASSASVFSERFSLDDHEEKIIAVGDTTDIFGTIRISGSDARVVGDISFLRRSTVKNLVSKIVVQTFPEVTIRDGEEVDFATTLLTGDYEVLVQPNAALANELPPMNYTLQLLGASEAPIPFVYPKSADMCTFSGMVANNLDQGMNGLQIKAVDRTSGQTVSSVVTTKAIDGQSGSFSLKIPKGANDYVLKVGPASTELIYPEVTIDPAYLFPQSQCEQTHTLLVPALQSSVEYRAKVVTSEEGAPAVPNAVVIVTSTSDATDLGVGQVHRLSALTNAEGEFEVKLLPGSYELIVRPESTALQFGVLATSVSVSTEGEVTPPSGEVIQLPFRHNFRGRVQSDSLEPMRGATVQAVALQSSEGLEEWPSSAYNRSNQTQTNDQGEFVLPLDVGRYDLVIQTPVDSGYPWVVVPDVIIKGDEAEASEQDFTLVTPIPVKGLVVDSRGKPLVGLEVIAHGVILHGSAQRSLQVGKIVTDESGRFTLLLAPLL